MPISLFMLSSPRPARQADRSFGFAAEPDPYARSLLPYTARAHPPFAPGSIPPFGAPTRRARLGPPASQVHQHHLDPVGLRRVAVAAVLYGPPPGIVRHPVRRQDGIPQPYLEQLGLLGAGLAGADALGRDVRPDSTIAEQLVEPGPLEVFLLDVQQARRDRVAHEGYGVRPRETQPVEAQHGGVGLDPELLRDLRRAGGLLERQNAGRWFPARLLEVVVQTGQGDRSPYGFWRYQGSDAAPAHEQALVHQQPERRPHGRTADAQLLREIQLAVQLASSG